MSCYETIDLNGTVTPHYTGGVTINLTSVSDSGAGYVPPACAAGSSPHIGGGYRGAAHTSALSGSHPATSVAEPGTWLLLLIGIAALGVNRVRRTA